MFFPFPGYWQTQADASDGKTEAKPILTEKPCGLCEKVTDVGKPCWWCGTPCCLEEKTE